MKFSRRPVLTLLIVTAAVPTALAWSAGVGRKVWSPRVFGWRNPLMPEPAVAAQPGCPLRIGNTRLYSFKSFLSSVGSVLKFDVRNVGDRAVHSFALSYHSPDPLDTGAIGVQPERLLRAGEAHDAGISARGKDRITLTIDFVQFADGGTWYADPPRETVKPEGVRAGAEASLSYLRAILAAEGAAAVMGELPVIRLGVKDPGFSAWGAYGGFGFDSGVTNTVVRVGRARREGGLASVEAFLRPAASND